MNAREEYELCERPKTYMDEIIHECSNTLRSMKNMLREQLKIHDLTLNEFEMLMYLKRGKRDTSKDLVKERGYSRSLVSKTADQLMKQGYLTAEQDKEDRRIMHLKLTEKAEGILGELEQFTNGLNEILRRTITREEIDAMKMVLIRMQACFEEMGTANNTLEDGK